jgi:hypothetical protein
MASDASVDHPHESFQASPADMARAVRRFAWFFPDCEELERLAAGCENLSAAELQIAAHSRQDHDFLEDRPACERGRT